MAGKEGKKGEGGEREKGMVSLPLDDRAKFAQNSGGKMEGTQGERKTMECSWVQMNQRSFRQEEGNAEMEAGRNLEW